MASFTILVWTILTILTHGYFSHDALFIGMSVIMAAMSIRYEIKSH